MNREIEFRVWSNQFNRFLSKEEYALDLDGKLMFVEIKDGFNVALNAVPSFTYTLQQYTSNKDKNKKKIYEGDILKTQGKLLGDYFRQGTEKLPAWPEAQTYTWLSKVVWDEGYASFLLEYFDQPNYHGRGGFSEKMIGIAPWAEVIGNIFETPELLKP